MIKIFALETRQGSFRCVGREKTKQKKRLLMGVQSRSQCNGPSEKVNGGTASRGSTCSATKRCKLLSACDISCLIRARWNSSTSARDAFRLQLPEGGKADTFPW